jgi:hypothetical protein
MLSTVHRSTPGNPKAVIPLGLESLSRPRTDAKPLILSCAFTMALQRLASEVALRSGLRLAPASFAAVSGSSFSAALQSFVRQYSARKGLRLCRSFPKL